LAIVITVTNFQTTSLGLTSICLLLLFCQNSFAVEYLANNSFEQPVAPANGNNFYATIPGWTLVPSPSVPLPANIVVPTAAYLNNPTSTPTGGARQYFDMNSAGGVVKQTVSLPGIGIASISCWFSVRDFPQNISGFGVTLKNSSGTIVGSATGTFTTADPIGLWKEVSLPGINVTAGNYTLEIQIDNFNNIDLAHLDFAPYTPQLQITKTASPSTPFPVGSTVTYTYIVKNIGNVAMTIVTVNDVHNGYGTAPIPKNEILFADVAPLGDSTNSVLNNGNWDVLGPGDTLKFTSTYIVTQTDVDLHQ
jgi:uncharacterized repeat protein (TIGR01451 family)